MDEYIKRKDALNADFRITVSLSDSKRKAAEKAVQAYADYINGIPAADIVPTVKGTWVPNYEHYDDHPELGEVQYGYVCSVCGRWEYGKEPFCNCGAKMGG